MSNYTLDLPLRYRIDLKMVKRRVSPAVDQNNLIPRKRDFQSWRNGNKLSRFFRHIFEHKKATTVLGRYFAVAALATTVLPQITPAYVSVTSSGETSINLSSS